MNNLSKRLSTIYDIVSGKVVADVGCDHGKLSFELLNNHKVDFAYISDISSHSLQKAIDLLNSYNLPYQAICCDGLKGYDNIKIDECIIAGMGGEEIIKIIQNSPITINSFVLSPQHNNLKVKKFLLDNNYDINFDIIIKDGHKFYNIIKFVKSNTIKQYDEFDLYFGKDNFTNPQSDLLEFVSKEIEKCTSISSKCKNEDWNRYMQLLCKCKERIEKYE